MSTVEQGGSFNFGPRLSQREYEAQIVALHSGLPSPRNRNNEKHIRRCELDLTIDFRLGKDFPIARRDQLWEVQQKIDRRRWILLLYWMLHIVSFRWLYRKANLLAEYVVNEYAKVLTEEELVAYFGKDERENPQLPPIK